MPRNVLQEASKSFDLQVGTFKSIFWMFLLGNHLVHGMLTSSTWTKQRRQRVKVNWLAKSYFHKIPHPYLWFVLYKLHSSMPNQCDVVDYRLYILVCMGTLPTRKMFHIHDLNLGLIVTSSILNAKSGDIYTSHCFVRYKYFQGLQKCVDVIDCRTSSINSFGVYSCET